MRQWLEIATKLRLFIRPVIASSVLSLIWYYGLFQNDVSFLDADESGFTDAIIPILAAFHAIVAGFVLNKVWSEYSAVQRCIRISDKESFLSMRDDRIPIPIHFLLGSLAFMIQGLVMSLHYEGVWAGALSTFCISFVLVMYFEVATNLDNPKKGVWYVGRIPQDWLE